MDFRELLNKIDSVSTEAKKEPERLAFDDAINHVKDIKFTPPLPSGIKFSSANNAKFKGQDINDPEVKLALFQDELKNSPARLLGEIGSRIKPTSDAQMDLSGHIASMGEKLASGSNRIGELSKPEQTLAIAAIKAALRGMELERDPDQSEYKDGEDEMESSLPWKKYESTEKQDDKVEEGDNIYHSCVKSFKHAKFGEGEVLHGEHTLSESGEVSHYDAKFVREDGSQFIVRNIPVANMKECVIVEHGHPKKKKKVKEEEVVDEAHYQDWKRKTIPVNKEIKLAGDSIWDKGTNPESVNVKEVEVTFEIDTESDDAKDRDVTYVAVQVEHDGPWTVYTDTGFERAISQMIGIDVEFTEQGMQDDGEASLEGSVATKDIPADAKPLESIETESGSIKEAQMDAEALKAWYNKYEDEQSWDAYGLAHGFFKWKLDSGIATDSMERSEVEALIKKFGEEEVMDDPFAAMEKAPELAPITTAMHNEFSKIVGKRYPDEEDFEKASNLIQDIDEDWFQGQNDVTLNGDEFYEAFGWIGENDENIEEAEYQGRTVKLNKPMRGDVKKFKVYVKNPKGNVVKVNFGDPDMKIKKSNPARRRSFRARHNCDTPGPKHKARYWSCRKW